MSNRLAHETSPYLLQHKDNPVDWFPWGDEAFEAAREQDKPIFLSVGYSACHWCHVMEHESFEDDETAALMNEHFINIKVDREERPDVDSIYMSAVQAMTGGGGWPMSVWLLPDGRPFYGGTYFPPTPRYGRPSFQQVLERIAEIYASKRDRLEKDADNLTNAISRRMTLDMPSDGALSLDVLDAAFQQIAARFDTEWGGFGAEPKFPQAMTLELLIRLYARHGWQHALDMVTVTLDRMMCGGMYDQVGGGFHRYSVDAKWLVPHFEKMLYDNALLIRAYLYGYQITGNHDYRRIVEQTAAYVHREMTSPQGGFYASQDADSEGEEGKFFVWGEEELRRLLTGQAHIDAVLDYWGVLAGPNFEGHSILWVPDDAAIVAERHNLDGDSLLSAVRDAREILFDHREERVKPGRDDKVLAAWNGLMISSFAQAGRALDRDDLVELAAGAARFVLTEMREDGRLRRSYKDGRARFNAYLEDYAFVIEGLIELYQATFDLEWFKEALALTEMMHDRFWDDEAGFYDTSHDHEALITRPQEVTDNATPSGTSGAVAVLVRMAILADRPEWRDKAQRVLQRLLPAIHGYPSAFAYLASQLDFLLAPPFEVAIVVPEDDAGLHEMLRTVRDPFRRATLTALHREGETEAQQLIPLLRDRSAVDNRTTAYVCQNFVCQLPSLSTEALTEQLAR